MPSPFHLPGLQHQHTFYILDVPEEKYGHHTALVFHKPNNTFRKAVAPFGRMEAQIAAATPIGTIPLRYPASNESWEEVEKAANASFPVETNEELVQELNARLMNRRNTVDVMVYVAKVKTRRKELLYDGAETSLPKGYLAFYGGRPSAEVDERIDLECKTQ